MKYCPKCQKQYTETWITFCSDDGTILNDSGYMPSFEPPTAGGERPFAPPLADQPTWRSPDPNAAGAWVAPDERQPVRTPAWQPPPAPPVYQRQQPSQGLAIASMIVGLLGFLTGFFCLGPIPGVVAVILGLVALWQIKSAPDRNAGKPFAIIGVVAGSMSVLIYGAMVLFWIIAAIFSS